MVTHVAYPVKVEGRLEPSLSRWLWLVKWFLAIPHYFVLVFLWIAFFLLSVVAGFSILFTGRYPRSIFDFNVGVMRWTWRVSYYAYGALGTDRYPPFSLGAEPDYPARLEIEYPEHLSRGLVLVKWWLLAIPHLVIVGVLLGGWLAWETSDVRVSAPGLLGVLVFISALMLMFTGVYPKGLFDLILGLNRWVLRVGAYVGLMTDAYPPFRLDMGETEPGSSLTIPPDSGPPPATTPPGAGGGPRGWTTGPIVAISLGAIAALLAAGLLAGGAGLMWLDTTQRDSAGYLTTDLEEIATAEGYALVSDDLEFHGGGAEWTVLDDFIGNARVRVRADEGEAIFVGLARSSDVDGYLSGAPFATVTDLDGHPDIFENPGEGAPAGLPGEQDFWLESASGTGLQTITWEVREGTYSIVVMDADAERGVAAEGAVGVEVPVLRGIAIGLLAVGAFFGLVALAAIVGAIKRSSSPA